MSDHKRAGDGTVEFVDYFRVLHDNEPYRLIFISYCIDNVGNWLTFVACVSITDKIGGASYTSIYLIIRLLPSFLWASVAGPLADRLNKRDAMLICSLGSACAVAMLSLPFSESYLIGMIYVSTFIQFTFGALYEPARNSCIPLFMSKSDLIVATTLDGLGWSVIGAFGSTLGGFINSLFGSKAAFCIDAFSYCLCAIMIYKIPVKACQLPSSASVSALSCPGVEMVDLDKTSTGELISIVEDRQSVAAEGSFLQGMQFLARNPFIVCVCLSKASGAAVWGVADILTVKQSQMSQYQTLGDESVTLGLIFAMVGVGCYCGPITWNSIIRQDEQSLVFAVVVSFLLLSVSYLFMVVSGHLWVVMVATVIRCFGSATIWIYSTLLLQLLVEPGLQGRVFAVERGVYVLCEISSIVYGAVAFDVLRSSVTETCAVMAAVGGVVFAAWMLIYVNRYGCMGIAFGDSSKHSTDGTGSGLYKPVPGEEATDTSTDVDTDAL